MHSSCACRADLLLLWVTVCPFRAFCGDDGGVAIMLIGMTASIIMLRLVHVDKSSELEYESRYESVSESHGDASEEHVDATESTS